jgi:uncharacterized protein (TIGR00661 family)
MARILYGVSGEGSGHSSRAREMAAHLQRQGHELWLVSYDRGYRNLKDDFRVFETEGLCIASVDNQVSVVKTFTENLKRLPEGHRKLQELRELFKEFQPHAVITDFEPMSAYLAQHYDVPLITVDNQHRMRYMRYECPPGRELESQVTRTIIRAMVPRPDVSLAITFFFGEPTNRRTFFFPPILRREVLELSGTRGDAILVYLTSGFESFIDELKQFPRERFVIYGQNPSSDAGHLTFKPFSKEGFLEDLATCKAVMATAGFTLISEALYLKKPYLALPMRGQFEQELNAFQLEQLGLGRNLVEITHDAIAAFLYHEPDYAVRLQEYVPGSNDAIQRKLDELLDNDAAGARWYHEHRDELSV